MKKARAEYLEIMKMIPCSFSSSPSSLSSLAVLSQFHPQLSPTRLSFPPFLFSPFSPSFLSWENPIVRTDISGLNHTRREWMRGARDEGKKRKKEKKKRERTPAAFSSSFLFCFSSFFRAFFSSLDSLTFFLGTSSSSSSSTSISSPFLFLLFFGDTAGGEFSMSGNIENPAASFRGESSNFIPSSSSSSDPSSSSSRAIDSRTFRIASAFLEGGSPVSKNLSRSSTWSRKASPNFAEGFSVITGVN